MEKKSVSATLLIIYLAALFAVVGSCFYAFVYKAKQIKIENIAIVAAENISVYNDEGKTEVAQKLLLSDMEVGLKPVTGKTDKDTLVPSTITDEGTSEGYYATVYVESSVGYKIVINNITIQSDKDELLVKAERKNICIAIKDVEGTVTNLEEDEIELVAFEDAQEPQKLTFLIWLDALAGEDLQGAVISFDLSFETI